MPSTYSISVGLPTEAFRKPTITSVLLDLPDNTQKLISPKDVRDAFLSTWANAAFKQTIGISSIEYIGIDSGNPSNRDIKQKIYLGKRNYAGVDIMNSNLLNPLSNDSDIFFYNTKPDNVTQSSTKISILAGTNSSLYAQAPYIESKLSNSSLSLDLNIVNPSIYGGPINILSQTGRVGINGIVFPSVTETVASASNGRILKYSGSYPNGSLKWADPEITISSIGTPGSPTYIYGSSSYVNGYPLEFIDDNFVAQTIGGVEIGSSFSAFSFYNGASYQNWPIVEVIRKILYPYVPPAVSLIAQSKVTGNNLVEIGVTTSIVFTYSITKYSEDMPDYQIVGPANISPYTSVPISSYTGLSFSGVPGDNITVGFTYSVRRLYPTTPITNNYVLQVSDSLPSFYTHSSTASLTFVSPIYTAFNSSRVSFTSSTIVIALDTRGIINTSTKHITNPPVSGASSSYDFGYSGSGYLYIIYPYNYPLLRQIKDPNGYIIHDIDYLSSSSFTYSTSTIDPWVAIGDVSKGNYRLYRTIATCSYTGSGSFEFIFN